MARILIVEDSPTQAQRLSLILEGAGHGVDWARSGAEGLERLGSSSYELVISDVMIPDFSGYELCSKAKADPASREIPFILLTSRNDASDILQGLQSGADNYLTKPYEPAALLSRIDTVLENRRLVLEGKLRVGVDVFFGGRRFVINSDKEQILGLLVSAVEDMARVNQDLQRQQSELLAAQEQLKRYARQTEGRARGAQSKYESLMEQAQDAVFLLDTQGRVEEANPRGRALLGRELGELVGRPLRAFAGESLGELLGRAAGEGAAQAEELRVLRPSGEERWADCSASKVRVDERDAVLLIARDMTERKGLARQQRQSQRLEAVGRLAGGVAHDFNNILTVINGFATLLREGAPASDPMREDLAEIVKAGERAAELTRQLLAFSRRQVLQPRLLDVNGVVRDLEKMLRRLLRSDISLELRLAPGLATVSADPGQIEQVLVNLVLNARDAMPKGGRIGIETTDVALDAAFARAHLGAREGAHVRLTVSDEGTGMDPETLAHAFEPFFTTKEQGKGTGLGLATVYGIIKQSGGSIFIESAAGRGTAFHIYLPAVQGAPEPARRPAQAGAARGSETILLVEDDEKVRAFVRRALSGLGYVVLEASDAEHALELCARPGADIALLLSDVVMPGMGGPELAGHARRRLPGLKTLFMSGYTREEGIGKAAAAERGAFLQKPMTVEALAAAVRLALDERP